MPRDIAPPVSSFEALPARIYLDTSTLHRLFDYGDVIWENAPFVPSQRARSVPGLAAELEALCLIFAVNRRAQFEFVVTAASLREVADRGHRPYTQWVRDVQATWLIQSDGERGVVPSRRERIGSVGAKDWALIADALDRGCDAFLTMDGPLVTQAPVIRRKTGLRVLRPTEHWALLKPWAALYL